MDDRSLCGIEDEKRFASKVDVARHWGVTRKTVDSWVKDGIVSVKAVPTARSQRYIADMEQVRVPRRTEGAGFTSRQAAKHVGLPVEVLRALRKLGYYEVRNLSSRVLAFHEKDVHAFKARLVARAKAAPLVSEVQPGAMTLGRILKTLKFGTAEHKAQFVGQFLDGAIEPVGRCGEDVGDICFAEEIALTLAREGRVLKAQGALSACEAAAFLHCQLGVVNGLIDAKYLERHWEPNKARVSKRSLDALSENYIALRQLAVDWGTSSARLMRLAKRAEIKLLEVRSRYHDYESPFLLRADMERLKKESELHPAEKR